MKIGRYTLERLIGQGGAGAVYESVHPLLQIPVAVKLMHSDAPETRQALLHEAQVAAALSHPHIVNIYEVGEYEGRPFLVMERFASSLAARLVAGPIPLAAAIDLLLPILDALAYAHRQGLIHCDLKPANMLLRSDGTPVLADFGLASQAYSSQRDGPQGTPAYVAPEQIRHQPLDARTDLYALGAVLFEMVTGRAPFEGDIPTVLKAHLEQTPPVPSTLRPGLPPALDALILAMLAKQPSQRPASVDAVAQALRPLRDAVAAATGPTIALPSLPTADDAAPPLPQPRRRQRKSTRKTAEASRQPNDELPKRQQPNMPRHKRAAKPDPLIYRWLFVGAFLLVLIPLSLLLAALAPDAAPQTPTATPRVGFALAEETAQNKPVTPTPVRMRGTQQFERLEAALMHQAQPAANTSDFSFGGLTWEDDSNALWFVGELRNDGNSPHNDVTVQIALLDANGAVLGRADGRILRSYLKPGEVSPFSLLFRNEQRPTQPFASYRLTVSSEPLDDFTRDLYERDAFEVVVTDAALDGVLQQPVVRGSVINTGSVPVAFVTIIATFYNAAGEVVGIGEAYKETGVNSFLTPEGRVSFEAGPTWLTQRDAARYTLFVEAHRQQS